MKKVYIFLGLAALMSLLSCHKILDIQPTTTFSTNTVWSSPALAQVFVNEIYAEAVLSFKDGGFAWGSQTDELYSNFNWCSENTYVQGQATPDNQGSSFPLNYSSTINFWSTLYSTIQKTNIFFANIGQLDTLGNGAAITSMTAQVHFLRALCYFELLKRFGGVPLITKVYTSTDNTYNESRSSWDSTENFILTDIAAALPGLQATAPSGQEGTATIGAALALKSRLLLYAASPYFNTSNDMARWQAAADAALAVINMSQYSLYGTSTTYGRIFTDFFNPEVIFARVYGNVLEDRYNTVYRDLSPNGYNGYSAYNVLEQMVDAFQMNDGTAFSWSNPAEAANPYANRDPRLYADILTNGASFQGRPAQFWLGGLDSKLSALSPWNASKTGYTILKMVDSTYNFNVQPYSPAQWIVFRLGEIYLNYAEAEAELGQTATALSYLNKIRERAGMPDVTSPGGTDLIQKIMQERRVELCFEGHRFFDLRRWGIADQGAGDALGIIITPTNAQNTTFTYQVDTVQVRAWQPSFYFYPIPRSEIQADPQLTQNPGYN
ncbi:MAG TPA: RagB/SusD family nutrient uptake outer membrane protein [Puia sp.]|nr:RagB/SusD family nutrient uptake outer membrane protein [Puia sp.]